MSMKDNIYWNPIQAPNFGTASQLLQGAGANLADMNKGLANVAQSFKNAEIARQQGESNVAKSQAINYLMTAKDPNQITEMSRKGLFNQFLNKMLPADQAAFSEAMDKHSGNLAQTIYNIAQSNWQNAQASKIQYDQQNEISGTQKSAAIMQQVFDEMRHGDITLANRDLAKQGFLNRIDGKTGKAYFSNPAEAAIFGKAFDQAVDAKLGMHGSDQAQADLATATTMQSLAKGFHVSDARLTQQQQAQVDKLGSLVTQDLDPTQQQETANRKEFHDNLQQYATTHAGAVRNLNIINNADTDQAVINRAIVTLQKSGLDKTNKPEFDRQMARLKLGLLPTAIKNEALFNTGTSKYGFKDLPFGIGETLDRDNYIEQAATIYLRMLRAQGDQRAQTQSKSDINFLLNTYDNILPKIISGISVKDLKGVQRTPAESKMMDYFAKLDPNKAYDPATLRTIMGGVYAENLAKSKTSEGSVGDTMYLHGDNYNKVLAKNPKAKLVNIDQMEATNKQIAKIREDAVNKFMIDPNNPSQAPDTTNRNPFIPKPIEDVTAPKNTLGKSIASGDYIKPTSTAEKYLDANNYNLTKHARDVIDSNKSSDPMNIGGGLQLYKDADTGDIYSDKDLSPSKLVGTKKTEEQMKKERHNQYGLSSSSQNRLAIWNQVSGAGQGDYRTQARISIKTVHRQPKDNKQ